MDKPLRIGIVGGGQLGKMLTQSAKQLGFFVAVVDPTPGSPAGQVADKQIVADYKDEAAIRELAALSDVLTFEIELANDEVLLAVMKNGTKVHPYPETLGIIRDKLKQKYFLKQNRIPTARFMAVETEKDILAASQKFGFPLLLKARTDAYDGRGNFVVKSRGDIKRGLTRLSGRTLYVEEYVSFSKELAVMVARSVSGKLAVYPVVETIHQDNICDTVIAPAPVAEKVQNRAEHLALRSVRVLKGAGVFGVEMFLTTDNAVLVNEIAPRVHNSGHYTIEGCVTSQFEQHIRAISDLPLGKTTLLPKAVVMKNLLGTRNGAGFPKGFDKALSVLGVSLHIYGKQESRLNRKMGT